MKKAAIISTISRAEMSDLISVRSLLKNSAQLELTHDDGSIGTYINVKAVMHELEYNNVDAVEFKHGHWVPIDADILFRCSKCECEVSTEWDYDQDEMWSYCPHCGTKMDEVSE